jgi:hypothetical protein
MSRPCGFRVAWMAVLVLAAGCQNYNFNPVGHCVMQPASETFTVSNVSTADVLFVIDDSGSMAAEQDRLAANFNAFITILNQTNLDRATRGLRPIDFHLAITTTSVFYNYTSTATTWTCKASCGTAGQACCTATNQPVKVPRACTSDSQCGGGNVRCLDDCHFTYQSPAWGPFDLNGERYCCDASTKDAPLLDNMACSAVDKACGTFEHHYDFSGSCQPGVAADGAPYPRGRFVGAGTNPRVLHFDKSLYPVPESTSATNRQGFTKQELTAFFAGNPVGTNANVKVGTCGSGQEQGLEAARLAFELSAAGQQADTYSMAGGKQQVASRAEWPHDGSKLVLVFVGDEDDCSSPDVDPSTGIVIVGATDVAGSDACVRNDGGKEYDVASRYVSYFTGLGRPLGAAFIESASATVCGREGYAACAAGKCCQPDCPTNGSCSTTGSPTYCGGQGAGTRFFQAASAFATAGADVVTGSVCDPDFGTLLGEIAEMIVKLPSTLTLPSVPAQEDIAVLRIADSSGETVKLCGRPAPSALTAQQARDQGFQWWFVQSENADPTSDLEIDPWTESRFVFINPLGTCIASPGETYSAEYIAKLPAKGSVPSDPLVEGCGNNPSTGETGEEMCMRLLGGQYVNVSGTQEEPWTCYVPGAAAGSCDVASYDPISRVGSGTCLCGARSQKCSP